MPAVTDQHLSYFDLYFFAPMGIAALEPARTRLTPLIKPTLGASWWSDLGEASRGFRAAVDKLVRERAETGEAVAAVDQTLARLSPWRRLIENAARRAPKQRRQSLLRAAGYGLGSARSVKEAKDFLLEVHHLVDLHDEELARLGVPDEARAFPKEALAALEANANALAREKAEDGVAADDVREAQARLLPLFDAAWLAVEGEIAAAEFAGDGERRREAAAVLVGLESALGEARVEARKRAAEGGVPVGLSNGGTADEVEQ